MQRPGESTTGSRGAPRAALPGARIVAPAVIALSGFASGCRLGPLVDDVPGASAHLLPAGASVPSVADNPALAGQIVLNDGLADVAPGDSVPRGTGMSAGGEVRFWSFGPAAPVASSLYQFLDGSGDPIDHPGLVDALPGDPGYSPIHALYEVVVSDAYAGELITSTAALADAVELGLVGEPERTDRLVASPIVLPATRLEVGEGEPIAQTPLYARGHRVAMFRFGQQVDPGQVPSRAVSFLRAAKAARHDVSRPIFEAEIPGEPANVPSSYTPLSAVIRVDLAPGIDPVSIDSDDDLFVRDSAGAITELTDAVSRLDITGEHLLLQLQFAEAAP